MKGVSKFRKVFKTVGIVFLILIILLLLVIGVIFVIDKAEDAKAWDEFKEAGYVNQVSVGSHNLNVCVKGNADSPYTIVSIAGLNSMANVVEMEFVTDQLKDKYRFAFVDRSGYGLSDDTHEEQTVEQVVSDYRTALKNAGLKAPYILMPHSYGGVYVSYWQATYPDEVKAIMYIDPTQIGDVYSFGEDMSGRHADLFMYTEVVCSKIGLDRFVFDPTQYTFNLRTQKQKDLATKMWRRCPMSWAVCSEENNYFDNVKKTYDKLVPNDIPKLYIDTRGYTIEDIRANMQYEKEIMKIAGEDTSDFEAMESMIDQSFADSEKKFYEMHIKTYIDKLGNVDYVNIPGDHSIFKHKPDEVAKALENFLENIK